MRLQKDSREFIKLLNSEKTKSLIFGTQTLARYCRLRFTYVLVLFSRNPLENAQRVTTA